MEELSLLPRGAGFGGLVEASGWILAAAAWLGWAVGRTRGAGCGTGAESVHALLAEPCLSSGGSASPSCANLALGVTRTFLEGSGALGTGRETTAVVALAPTDGAWVELFAALGASPAVVLSAPAIREELAQKLVAVRSDGPTGSGGGVRGHAWDSFISPQDGEWAALSLPTQNGAGMTFVRTNRADNWAGVQVLPFFVRECSGAGYASNLCSKAVELKLRACRSGNATAPPPGGGSPPWGGSKCMPQQGTLLWNKCRNGLVVVVDSLPTVGASQQGAGKGAAGWASVVEQFQLWLEAAPTHRLSLKADDGGSALEDSGTASAAPDMRVTEPPPGGYKWCGAAGGVAVSVTSETTPRLSEASVSAWVLLGPTSSTPHRCPPAGATVLRLGALFISTADSPQPVNGGGQCELVVRAGLGSTPEALIGGLPLGKWTHLTLANGPWGWSAWVNGSPAGKGGHGPAAAAAPDSGVSGLAANTSGTQRVSASDWGSGDGTPQPQQGRETGGGPLTIGVAQGLGTAACVRDVRVYSDGRALSTAAALRIYDEEALSFEPAYAFPLTTMSAGANAGYLGETSEVILAGAVGPLNASTHTFTGSGLNVSLPAGADLSSMGVSAAGGLRSERVGPSASISSVRLSGGAWTLSFWLKIRQPALDAQVLLLWDAAGWDSDRSFVLDVRTVWGRFPRPGEDLPLQLSAFFGSAMARSFGLANTPVGLGGAVSATSENIVSDEALHILPGAWSLVTLTLEPSLPWLGLSCLKLYLNSTRAAPALCDIPAPETHNLTGALGLAGTGFDGYIRDLRIHAGVALTPDQVTSEFERRLAELPGGQGED